MTSPEVRDSQEKSVLTPLLGEGRKRDRLVSWSHQPRERNMSTFQLAVWVYLCVNGGPYGMEEAVLNSSPRVLLLVLIAVGIAWCAPLALVSCELAAAFDSSCGGVIEWIRLAFGNCMGVCAAWAYLLANLFDNCMYPMLVGGYVADALNLSPEMRHSVQLSVSMAVCALATGINCMGIQAAGVAASCLTACIIIPPIVIICVTLPKADPHEWISDIGRVDWSVMCGIVLWNFSGWEDLGNLATVVVNPQKAFPQAMGTGIIMMLLPTIVLWMMCISAQPDLSEWNENYLNTIASMFGGVWLRILVTLGAAVGLFCNLLGQQLVSGEAMCYCAKRGWLPKVFAKTTAQNSTPYVALITCGLAIGGLQFAPGGFPVMSQMWTCLYLFIVLGLLAAFLKLRVYSPPDLPKKSPSYVDRPFVAGGPAIWHAVSLALLPLGVVLVNFYFLITQLTGSSG